MDTTKSFRLWSKEVSKPQRAITWLFLVMTVHMFLDSFSLFTDSEFLVDQSYSKDMLFVSVFATVILILTVMHLHDKGLWKIYKQQNKHPILAKGSLLLSPLLVWVMLHLYFSKTLPTIYTIVNGQPVQVKERLIKKDENRRYHCNIRLEVERTATFVYCISKQTYSRLPEGEFEVTLIGKKTEAGILVEEVWYQDEFRL
ncbi:hypothetical protein L1D16_12855 [Vibrio sp. Isolate31]|uniref:hypothetical protein n=1 Tax=unclassified Vibrio TaxID=2614977 RepID=UPI001EFC4881|nr:MULTISPECIES: hypothetical protein [unclassified Vibrio]MCG9555310.1 hypothetical protein [Vibrio sp. Isolate32]MCG9601747.1 hypothetical protein [Vibrio sp. Isolate31]